MSYDPFAQRNLERQQAYHDSPDFDPYGQSAPQPHASYDPTPYKDEALSVGTMTAAAPGDKEFDPFRPPPKWVSCMNIDNRGIVLTNGVVRSTGDLRIWRHDAHGNLWTKVSALVFV